MTSIRKQAAGIVILTLLSGSICYAAPKNETDHSLPALHRGTNIAAWLTRPERKIYLRDALEIRNAGFDFVRLPIDPKMFHFTLESDEPVSQEIDFYTVDKAIALMNSVGLAVVLDLHPEGDFKLDLEKGGKAEDRFAQFWTALAAHYSQLPTRAVAYQLLNEPQYYNKEAQWAALQSRLVAAVRSADKDHLIILCGAQGSSIEGLLNVVPVDDTRVAYDFHFYEPYIVTHQGAWWFPNSQEQIRFIQNVPYPSSLVDRTKVSVSKGGHLDAALVEVDRYTGEGWNKAHVASRIQSAAHWAHEHHVRLLNLEFGVLIVRIDPASRFRWLSDVRTSFDANGIGWAVFDYTDSFAIVKPNGETTTNHDDGSMNWTYPQNIVRKIDPAAISALGLHPKTAH